MACVNEKGQINASAKKVLEALMSDTLTPEEISKNANMPLFKVRSGLREMVSVAYVIEENGSYKITNQGEAALKSSN